VSRVKSPHLHPHRKVLALYIACRNVVGVRPSVDDLGYNLRDAWWGVPRVGAIVLSVIAEQFQKLSKVGLPSEDALNSTVEVIAVRGDLKAFFRDPVLSGRTVPAIQERLPLVIDVKESGPMIGWRPFFPEAATKIINALLGHYPHWCVTELLLATEKTRAANVT
jgi:hypothetical protein